LCEELVIHASSETMLVKVEHDVKCDRTRMSVIIWNLSERIAEEDLVGWYQGGKVLTCPGRRKIKEATGKPKFT